MSSTARVPTVSIRYTIPAIFAALIVVTVGVIGWLAFRSGQQAIDGLATQLSRETTARIEEHASAYVTTPHLFHQINAAAIRTDNLDAGNFGGLEPYLWEQVRLTGSVPFIYYGTEQGEIVGVERKEDGAMALWILDKEEDPNLNIFPLDDDHVRLDPVDSIPFDPRGRPWYVAAVETGGPTWSTIYPDISRPILVITAVAPVYDAGGTLQGVLGIDLSLGQISDFMRDLEIGRTGQAFIVERTGDIVASSADEPPSITTDEGQERLNVVDSGEPLIRSVGQALQEQFGGLEQIDTGRQLILALDGVDHFVQVASLQDGRGLDWLIVVVVPETDFMEPIYSSVRSTVVLGLAILALAAVSGFFVARWFIRPVMAVADAAAAVEAARFVPESLEPVARRTDELGTLARLFQRMAQEVHAREQWLKQQLQQLRIEIDEVRRKKQVDGIVETEFFRDLQAKARTMRGRGEPEDKEDS
jgi:HAMP domain-containing protein